MALRVVVYRSSHNYCPSLLCSSLSRALLLLRCLSRCRLWLSHLSLAATHRVPSLSHLPPFSHTYRHSVTRSLSHTLIPFPAPCDIRSLSPSLSRWARNAGQTGLRSPPATAVACREAAAQPGCLPPSLRQGDRGSKPRSNAPGGLIIQSDI